MEEDYIISKIEMNETERDNNWTGWERDCNWIDFPLSVGWIEEETESSWSEHVFWNKKSSTES